MTRYSCMIALLAGLASATGFAPLGLWPVTLVCVATLMMLVAAAPTWRAAFGRGWCFGVGHFALGMNWIAHAFVYQDAMPHWLGYIAVVALSLYLAVYPAVGGLLAWKVGSSTRRPARAQGEGPAATPFYIGPQFTMAFAAAWIVTEYARATFFTGFAWNPLGVIWLGTPLAEAARWIGTYGLSGLAILVVGICLWLIGILRRRQGTSNDRILAVAVACALIVVFAAPRLRPSEAMVIDDRRPLLRIVQHNTSQAERHDSNHDELSVQALERLTGAPGNEPRLILWPEAAVPYFLEEERFARTRLARLLGPSDILLTGGDALIYSKAGDLIAARNSLFAMTADASLIARYDKAHLVPYGEYLPMRPLLSAIGLSRLVPGDLDFWSGPGPRTMMLPGFGTVGAQICYEITFSGQVVDRAHRPDFIFNPSTDAWFGDWGPPEHLAQARLRAMEEGLPVIRATPTGISAVIDADGRVLAALPRNKPGFLTMRLPPPHPPTTFARYGNALPMLLALVLAILAVAPGALRRYSVRL